MVGIGGLEGGLAESNGAYVCVCNCPDQLIIS